MLNQPTMEKLHTMKLYGMADAFRTQLETTESHQLSFEERFALLVDHQWLWKENRALGRRLRAAKIEQFRRDMLAGKWRLTGQAIHFNVRGQLIDGFHRLTACVAAGVMDILGTRAVPHTFNKLRQVWFFQWLNLRVCDMSLPRALILAIAAVF